MTGMKMNYKKHCRLTFGAYAQTHEEEQPRNSATIERTLGAICLGPENNLEGTYKFMSLTTARKISRSAFTPVPMTDEVIKCVEQINQLQKIQQQI